jgi:hypothetical protein
MFLLYWEKTEDYFSNPVSFHAFMLYRYKIVEQAEDLGLTVPGFVVPDAIFY